MADLVDDQAGRLDQEAQQPRGGAGPGSPGETVPQLGGLDEVGLELLAAALVADGHGEVGLAGARRTHEHDVPVRVDRRQGPQALERRGVPALEHAEVEVVERLRMLPGQPAQLQQRVRGLLVLPVGEEPERLRYGQRLPVGVLLLEQEGRELPEACLQPEPVEVAGHCVEFALGHSPASSPPAKSKRSKGDGWAAAPSRTILVSTGCVGCSSGWGGSGNCPGQ